jgi:dynein heavy chain
LIVLKALRPDKLNVGIMDFITAQMSQEFVDPPTFNLTACFGDSSNIAPLVFVLSPGTDPVADLRKFGEETGFSDKIGFVSLG